MNIHNFFDFPSTFCSYSPSVQETSLVTFSLLQQDIRTCRMQVFNSVQVLSIKIKISSEMKIWAEITKNCDFFIENPHNSAQILKSTHLATLHSRELCRCVPLYMLHKHAPIPSSQKSQDNFSASFIFTKRGWCDVFLTLNLLYISQHFLHSLLSKGFEHAAYF